MLRRARQFATASVSDLSSRPAGAESIDAAGPDCAQIPDRREIGEIIMASRHDIFRIWAGPLVLVLATAIALLCSVVDGAAQGTSAARLGSAGLDAGTLVGSIGGGHGLAGGTAAEANRIRGVAAPASGENKPPAAASSGPAPAAPADLPK
jgi:hypothetical protein